MKFTREWLAEHLESDATVPKIAEALTALGLEVESIDDPAAALDAFTVAEIREAVQHPDADRLRVCRVETAGGVRQIVCGAPNARAGIKVALADIGAIIPNGGFEIKPSKIRGVESQGMLCSAKELGLGEDSAGILELPETAVVGEKIARVLGLGDVVIDIAVTPNRGDCLGVRGIARELAAKGIGTLKPLDETPVAAAFPADRRVWLETPDCPLFVGRTIRGVTNGESPDWLKRRLAAVGLRPISTLVDITNLFTLGLGRPLHVFDAGRLRGDLRVTRSRGGETLAALNDKTYILPAGLCVVSDDSGPLGLGGVIGGSASGCSMETTTVFLEAAWFEPEAVARTGRALFIDSDARYRFERGVDPRFVLPAAEMATRLIIALCGGEASEPIVAGSPPDRRIAIDYTLAMAERLSGVVFDATEVERLLGGLGFDLTASGDGWQVTPPSWRPDVAQAADLTEELLRLRGYDALAESALPSSTVLPDPVYGRQSRLRRLLAARGLDECYHFAFATPESAALFARREDQGGVTILNPINAAEDVMRPSLLPALLDAAGRNLARGRTDLALFELGHVFHGLEPEAQPLEAAGIRLGETTKKAWDGEARRADAHDAKADLFACLDALGIDTRNVQTVASAPGYYHPGQSGSVQLGPKLVLGYFGALHPKILRAHDIAHDFFVFELRLSALPLPKARSSRALRLSEYQASQRDFAFVVDRSLPAAELMQAIAGADKLIRSLRLFDVYQGKGVPEGKKSLAFTLTLQADDRTLSDTDLQRVSDAVIAAAGRKQGTLRG